MLLDELGPTTAAKESPVEMETITPTKKKKSNSLADLKVPSTLRKRNPTYNYYI